MDGEGGADEQIVVAGAGYRLLAIGYRLCKQRVGVDLTSDSSDPAELTPAAAHARVGAPMERRPLQDVPCQVIAERRGNCS